MASVQELLAAADASKSPFQGLLEGLSQGFGQGYAAAPERRRQMLALQDEEAARQRAVENDQMLRAQLQGKTDAQTKTAFNAAGAPGTPAHGGMRLAQVTIDPKSQL
jgi:hypothetical protein